MKVIGIVENSPITGVRYGLIEMPETTANLTIPMPRVLNAQQNFVKVQTKHHMLRKTCKTK